MKLIWTITGDDGIIDRTKTQSVNQLVSPLPHSVKPPFPRSLFPHWLTESIDRSINHLITHHLLDHSYLDAAWLVSSPHKGKIMLKGFSKDIIIMLQYRQNHIIWYQLVTFNWCFMEHPGKSQSKNLVGWLVLITTIGSYNTEIKYNTMPLKGCKFTPKFTTGTP